MKPHEDEEIPLIIELKWWHLNLKDYDDKCNWTIDFPTNIEANQSNGFAFEQHNQVPFTFRSTSHSIHLYKFRLQKTRTRHRKSFIFHMVALLDFILLFHLLRIFPDGFLLITARLLYFLKERQTRRNCLNELMFFWLQFTKSLWFHVGFYGVFSLVV